MPTDSIKRPADVPDNEAWLYDNPTAIEEVRKGLEAAKKGEIYYVGSFVEFVKDESD